MFPHIVADVPRHKMTCLGCGKEWDNAPVMWGNFCNDDCRRLWVLLTAITRLTNAIYVLAEKP